jgi:hypothetical protein
MMRTLKGVIFSLRDVILHSGHSDPQLLSELERLILWLRQRSVQPIFVGNHSWSIKYENGKEENAQAALNRRWGDCPWYIADRGDIPFKPKSKSMEAVLNKHGWVHNEAIFVGNTENDMRTARNGKLLFLNALWHGEGSPYGYQFDSPKDVARFIDCFCLGVTDWYWSLQKDSLRVYCLGPFSTVSPQYSDAKSYSVHARSTAKHLGGDATFWGRLLASRLYFSGLVDELDYIAPYPGHSPTSQQQVTTEALTILADSLQKRFLPDLILRHAPATKSQTARASGKVVDHLNQLNTIHLNKAPLKNKRGNRYVHIPVRSRKTVLVIDDFCTQGNSFEAARAYLEKAGARAICLGWLKTINTDYLRIVEQPSIIDPFAPNTISESPRWAQQSFHSGICNGAAMANLNEIFSSYYQWDWPQS